MQTATISQSAKSAPPDTQKPSSADRSVVAFLLALDEAHELLNGSNDMVDDRELDNARVFAAEGFDVARLGARKVADSDAFAAWRTSERQFQPDRRLDASLTDEQLRPKLASFQTRAVRSAVEMCARDIAELTVLPAGIKKRFASLFEDSLREGNFEEYGVEFVAPFIGLCSGAARAIRSAAGTRALNRKVLA